MQYKPDNLAERIRQAIDEGGWSREQVRQRFGLADLYVVDRKLMEGRQALKRRAQRGQALVEYALLMLLIVLVVIIAVAAFGSAIATFLSHLAAGL